MKKIIFSLSLLLNAMLLVVVFGGAFRHSSSDVAQAKLPLNAVFVYSNGWEGNTAHICFVQVFSGKDALKPGFSTAMVGMACSGPSTACSAYSLKTGDGELISMRVIYYDLKFSQKGDFVFKESSLFNVPPTSVQRVLSALNALQKERPPAAVQPAA